MPRRPFDPLPNEKTSPFSLSTIVKLSPQATFIALFSKPNYWILVIGIPAVSSEVPSKSPSGEPSYPSVRAPAVNSSPLLVSTAVCVKPSDR